MSYVGTNGGNRTLAQALPNWKWAFVPQVGLHTTEFPVGHSLLGLFQFLNTRTTHGSYHAAADANGRSGQYCPWSWGAWHAPSINRWSVGVAGNCRASEWDTMTRAQRDSLIKGMALQAHRYSRWCVSQGLGPVPARRLTKAQAERREHGFVYHGALQSDRTDPTGPRDRFPWSEFIAEFIRLEAGATATTAAQKETPVSGTLTSQTINRIAEASARAVYQYRGRDFWNEKPQIRDTQFARTYQRAEQTWSKIRELEAMIVAQSKTLDKVLKSKGEILKAVEDAQQRVVKVTAEEVAAELQAETRITTKEAK